MCICYNRILCVACSSLAFVNGINLQLFCICVLVKIKLRLEISFEVLFPILFPSPKKYFKMALYLFFFFMYL